MLNLQLLVYVILSVTWPSVSTTMTQDSGGYYGIMNQFYGSHFQNKRHGNFMDQTLVDAINKNAASLLQKMPANDNITLNQECFTKVMQLAGNIKSAVPYIDALGKPGAGVTEGNMIWLGSYEECLTIPDAHFCNIKNIRLKQGQLILPLTYGICTPSACSVGDIIEGLNMIVPKVNNYTMKANISISVNPLAPSFCSVKDLPYSDGAIAMIIISSIILVLCFIGTVVELIQGMLLESEKWNNEVDAGTLLPEFDDSNIQTTHSEFFDGGTKKQMTKEISMHTVNVNEQDTFLVRFITCFSWVKNTKALLNTDVPKGSITSINGIRTISITWVVLGHVLYFLVLLQLSDNPGYILEKWLPRFSMEGLLNATVSVDTFFLLSGLLVSYLSLKRMESTGSLPLLRYYLHRYIRLTPSYAFLIFFMTYLLPYLGYGPQWPSTIDPNCSKSWWTNLLYINNIYSSDVQKECYGVAWYLAIDMQYYVISPIILYCMFKFKWIGVAATSAVFFLQNFITNGVLVAVHKASSTFQLEADEAIADFTNPDTASTRYQKFVYFKTYTRFGPYMVGLVLGYVLFYKKTVRASLRPFFFGAGWLVAIGTGLSVVYGPHANDKKATEAVNVIYCMLFRTVWAIAVGWVIYASHNGYGGLINKFLSWRAFIPLSRMTYGVYLIHIYVILFYGYTLQTPFHVTEITFSFLFIGITFVSYMLSFLVAVCIEYPVFNLEQLVISHFKTKTKPNAHTRF